MRKLVDNLIQKTNAFDVNGALSLFSSSAVVDDVSVGDAFRGIEGVRLYLDQFFVGYKTATQLRVFEELDEFNAVARFDFTGDFGHETGVMKITINSSRLIERIDADLE